MVETWVTGEAAARERQSQKGIFPCADGIKVRERDSEMSESWFDKTCTARNELRIIAAEAEELAHSCSGIGLDTLATRLFTMSEGIRVAELDLSKAIGQGLDAYIDAVNQGSTNMIRTCIGIATVLEKKKGDQE